MNFITGSLCSEISTFLFGVVHSCCMCRNPISQLTLEARNDDRPWFPTWEGWGELPQPVVMRRALLQSALGSPTASHEVSSTVFSIQLFTLYSLLEFLIGHPT